MMDSPRPYTLRVLGGCELTAPDGTRVSSVLAQPKRLCLLTYLTLCDKPPSRATVAALFWPESDETRARNALNQAVFYLRRSMTASAIESVEGDRLCVSEDRVWCDARTLLREEDPDDATIGSASGPLLAGWNADDSQPLQEWLDATRRVLQERAERLDPTPRQSAPAAPTKPAEPLRAPTADHGPTSRPAPRRTARTVGFAFAAVVAVSAVAVAPWSGQPDLASATRISVVGPTLVTSGETPAGLDEAIRMEVLTELSRLPGLEVLDIPLSPPDFDRVLDAATPTEGPDLRVRISVVVTDTQIRTTALLIGRAGLARDGARAEATYADTHELLGTAPRSVAAAVRDMIRNELGTRATRAP